MVGHSDGRNTGPDGYNIGMKYQCVEFVKRYYYQRFHHKMPDSYGNAKEFYDAAVPDSGLNQKRALLQFCNGSISKPRLEDLLIFDGHPGNPYGPWRLLPVLLTAWFVSSSKTAGRSHIHGIHLASPMEIINGQ